MSYTLKAASTWTLTHTFCDRSTTSSKELVTSTWAMRVGTA